MHIGKFGLIGLALSTAITTSAIAQSPAGQPDWLSQAKIVAEMQDISVGEAVRRARLQEQVASQAAKYEADDNYAGAWIVQNRNSFRAHFAFRGGGAHVVDDSEVAQSTSFENARYSLKEIHAERERLGKLLPTLGINASFGIRVQANELQLFPDDATKVRALVSSGTLSLRDFVVTQEGPLRRKPEAAVSGGGKTTGQYVDPVDGYTYGQNCAAAFTVTTGSARGISTAGHCAKYSGQTQTHRGLPIGVRQGYQEGDGIDAAWFRNTANTYDNRVLWGASYYSITSVGQMSPPPGTAICIIRWDDTQPCSYVRQVVYFPNNDGPYTAMDRDSTVDHDSGAPWLYGGGAHGVHYGDVSFSDQTVGSIFTPAASLPRMGISVVTTP